MACEASADIGFARKGPFEACLDGTYDAWIKAHYQGIETAYIIHDAVAHLVDEHTFYHTRESGGTKISSAYELANQLVGRLKAKLLARGATIALSTPVVLRGVRLSPLPRTDVDPVVFESTSGKVLVWLEVEIETDFQLGEERALKASEGELLVF